MVHLGHTTAFVNLLRVTCLEITQPTVSWDILYQLTINKMPHRHAHWQTWWRQLFNWHLVFPADCSLCQFVTILIVWKVLKHGKVIPIPFLVSPHWALFTQGQQSNSMQISSYVIHDQEMVNYVLWWPFSNPLFKPIIAYRISTIILSPLFSKTKYFHWLCVSVFSECQTLDWECWWSKVSISYFITLSNFVRQGGRCGSEVHYSGTWFQLSSGVHLLVLFPST